MRLAALIALTLAMSTSANAQLVPIDVQAESQREAWPVKTSLIGTWSRLAIQDEDPANDQAITYLLRSRGEIFKRGTLVFGLGLEQRFVAEEDDSSLRLGDTIVGFEWETPFKLSDDTTLSLTHVLWAFLPTSRVSQRRDLIFAPVWQLRANLMLPYGFTVGAAPYFRYRFHEYAERDAATGLLNTQLDFGIRGGVDYQAFGSETYGVVLVGASAGTSYDRDYDARDPTGQEPWGQSYDWEGHILYIPQPYLIVGLSAQQGAPLQRNGVSNAVLFHRDETELALTVGLTL